MCFWAMLCTQGTEGLQYIMIVLGLVSWDIHLLQAPQLTALTDVASE
jgi:hypothetical protein